ncbi:MAG: hypothetical protein JXR84_07070 [Anaerolineae bacterium]|nr:hypothetical protein [Anaerolineae bacterium]
MNAESQRSPVLKELALERPVWVATLLAACLGGTAAWATTGVFSIVVFLVVVVLGFVAQTGLSRLKPYLPWVFVPLLVIVVYWTQTRRLDWLPMWPALILTATWVWCLLTSTRFRDHSYVAVYVLLLTGVAVGGIPVWCLLCLLPAPLAWRAHKSADAALSEEWAIVTGMFLIAGYLIKGLVR